MSLHKLSAGDGYTYLTRQVAAHDRTDRGHSSLGDYYADRGESPGRWWGAGLTGVDIDPGELVSEAQMLNLFGHGRHPNATSASSAEASGQTITQPVEHGGTLGQPFRVYDGPATEFLQEVARRFAADNRTHGRHWQAPVPPEVRARIRTQVADELFAREHGRAPLDQRERAGYLARESRQQTRAVAGYDLTFTPVKSVSALWALADPELAREIADAHDAAVTSALTWLESEGLFTRQGHNGIQQVPARGLLATRFVHRDSRAGDPNLHTHVAISNKCQTLDGRWLAVDGRPVHSLAVSVSELYNSRIEAELSQRIGLRFASRSASATSGASGIEAVERLGRDVREVAGLDPRLLRAWSKRSVMIEARRRQLASRFQDEHGRPPTVVESIALAQQANLETRQAKHEPRSEAEQRQQWRSEAIAVLGSADAVDDMVTRTLGGPGARTSPGSSGRSEHRRFSRRRVRRVAKAVVRAVESDRATWQEWHLRAEALRQTRRVELPADALETTVERVVRAAIGRCIPLSEPDPLLTTGTGPAALQRPSGESVYVQHRSTRYTSARIMRAEEQILEAALRTDGRQAPPTYVDLALTRAAASGTRLTTAQEEMVRQMACSGRRLELALAPAGTGKTTALSALADTWRMSGGWVIGLAPSAVAAHQLRLAIDPTHRTPGPTGPTGPSGQAVVSDEAVVSDTVAKLVHSLKPESSVPDWVASIDRRTLVLIDEAGMAATTDLATVIDHAMQRGASVKLIGDDRQLGAVQAGGILRDLAHHGPLTTLTEVRRFADPAEAAATLALREGDAAALGFYADHQRVHVGDIASCADQAYQAWAADQADGRASILLAPTRELVAELNQRARLDRITPTTDCGPAPAPAHAAAEITLADGLQASAGDLVLSRRNNRTLRTGPTDWVKNGDRWTIQHVHLDGSLTVRRASSKGTVRLPASYVSDHVHLGYATTIHGAQGTTVDTAHTVLAGLEDRSLLYVAATRGRHANHLYVTVATDGDPHTLTTPEAIHPPTATDVLIQILTRDHALTSATTTRRQAHDPATLLADATARYTDALHTAAQELLGPDWLTTIGRTADRLVVALTDSPAWPTLRAHLALAELDRHNSHHLLSTAVQQGALTDAHDPAAVLDARLPLPTSSDGPLPWLHGIPTRLITHPTWGSYLRARYGLVTQHATTIKTAAGSWTPATAPSWAQPIAHPHHQALRADLALWRAAEHVPDSDPRPTGPPQPGRPGDHQRRLARAFRTIQPHYPTHSRPWYHYLPEEVLEDPWADQLLTRLTTIEQAGVPLTSYLARALPTNPHRPDGASTNNPPQTSEHNSRSTQLVRPLPDEHAASALWWRLVPHLGPAALDTDRHTHLRPTWLPVLIHLTGQQRADFLQHTPAWSSLVAAVDNAVAEHDWRPEIILATALETLHDHPPLNGHHAAAQLTMRIAALTDPDLQPPLLVETAVSEEDDTLHDAHVSSHLDTLRLSLPETDPAWHVTRRWLTAQPQAGMEQSQLAGRGTGTSPDRIVELNAEALTFYRGLHAASWTAPYLRDRLGTDLIGHPTIRAGYAPPGPRSLLRHLTSGGATLDELIEAGLVRERQADQRGRSYVDVFRDRLILPLLDPHDPDRVIGFVGRRNPTKTENDYAGPKYLNTKTTPVFTKGQTLYGLAENTQAIRAGAQVVLTEGPLDAIAVTLTCPSRKGYHSVGVAPLGTALSDEQISLLEPHCITHPARITIATDADEPGQRSAARDYWKLTTIDADPKLACLPAGLDPASLLERHGPESLRQALQDAIPMAEQLLNQLRHDQHAQPNPLRESAQRAAELIASRPASAWHRTIADYAPQLGIEGQDLLIRTLEESIERDLDPVRYAKTQQHRTSAPRTPDISRATPRRTTTSELFARKATEAEEPHQPDR